MRALKATIATTAVLIGTIGAPAPTAEATQSRCWGATFMRVSDGGFAEVPTRGGKDGNVGCILAYGDRTAGVRTLQRTLNRCYGYRLAEDAIYGSRTRAAVERVQRQIGAHRDGIYGPQTSKMMAHYSTTGTCGRH